MVLLRKRGTAATMDPASADESARGTPEEKRDSIGDFEMVDQSCSVKLRGGTRCLCTHQVALVSLL
jgi:hypothetical protein